MGHLRGKERKRKLFFRIWNVKLITNESLLNLNRTIQI